MNRTFLILSACLGMLAACNSGGDAPVETPDRPRAPRMVPAMP